MLNSLEELEGLDVDQPFEEEEQDSVHYTNSQ